MRPRHLLTVIFLAAASRLLTAQAPTTLPTLDPLSEAEELRLAQTAAPRAIVEHATVLVHRSGELQPARTGDNGYVCFVERFEGATVTWPVCYEPEIARVVVPLNQLLERYRSAGSTGAAHRAARDSLMKTLPTPKPGGVSYRLSPDMWSRGQGGSRSTGPWMILITMPNVQITHLGFPAGTRSTGAAEPRFGVASTGMLGGYIWIDVEALKEAATPAKP